jgi:hypothetical protein
LIRLTTRYVEEPENMKVGSARRMKECVQSIKSEHQSECLRERCGECMREMRASECLRESCRECMREMRASEFFCLGEGV